MGGTFATIESLVGGTNNDTFNFSNTATLAGSVNGGTGGVNYLNFAAYTTAVNFTLTSSTVNGYVGTTTTNHGWLL